MTSPRSLALIAGTSMVVAGGASAQTYGSRDVVSWRGQGLSSSVPGLIGANGEYLGSSVSAFSSTAINNLGNVIFMASIGNATSLANDTGLWGWTPSTNLSIMMRSGAAASAYNLNLGSSLTPTQAANAVLSNQSSSTGSVLRGLSSSSIRFNDANQVIFGSGVSSGVPFNGTTPTTVTPNSGGFTNYLVGTTAQQTVNTGFLFIGSPSGSNPFPTSFDAIARGATPGTGTGGLDNTSVPGSTTATFSTGVQSTSNQGMGMNASGRFAISFTNISSSNLNTGTTAAAAAQQGTYLGTATGGFAGNGPLLNFTQTAPGATPASVMNGGGTNANMNASGAFITQRTETTGGSVTSSNNSMTYYVSPSGVPTLMYQTGRTGATALPGIVSTAVSGTNGAGFLSNFNNNNRWVFSPSLSGTGITSAVNSQTIYTTTPTQSAPTFVMQTGTTPLTGISGAPTASTVSGIVQAGSTDNIFHFAVVTGAGYSADSVSGTYQAWYPAGFQNFPPAGYQTGNITVNGNSNLLTLWNINTQSWTRILGGNDTVAGVPSNFRVTNSSFNGSNIQLASNNVGQAAFVMGMYDPTTGPANGGVYSSSASSGDPNPDPLLPSTVTTSVLMGYDPFDNTSSHLHALLRVGDVITLDPISGQTLTITSITIQGNTVANNGHTMAVSDNGYVIVHVGGDDSLVGAGQGQAILRIAIPTPGAAGLMGLAGLVAARRRRV